MKKYSLRELMAPKRENGFSLIEIMVALSVLGAAAYFIVSLLNNSMNTQRSITTGEDARSLTYDMASILTNPDACRASFLGQNPKIGFDATSIKKKNGSVAYALDNIYGNRTVKLTKIFVGGAGIDGKTNLEKYTDTSTDGKAGIALVVVDWDKLGENPTSTGLARVYRFFKIAVTLDPAGTGIVSCFSLGGVESGLWKRSITSPEKIYYSEGNVGIGTDIPAGTLTVHRPGDQGMLNVSGDGDGDETYSSLNLLDKVEAVGSAGSISWTLAHKKLASTPPLAHSFQIAHWKAGAMTAPFWISKNDKVTIGSSLDEQENTLTVVTSSTEGAGKNVLAVQNNSASGYSAVQFRDNGGTPKGAVGWNNAHPGAYLFSLGGAPIILGTDSTNLFTVRGNGDAEAVGTIFAGTAAPSDLRLKTELAPLDGYSIAKKLTGVFFRWKESGVREVGFIAQEVEKVVPELVLTMSNGLKALKLASITAILVEAFKTLDNKIQALTLDTENLKEENAALRKQLEALTKRLSALEEKSR